MNLSKESYIYLPSINNKIRQELRHYGDRSNLGIRPQVMYEKLTLVKQLVF